MAIFVNICLYQVGWFACVFGAAAGHPWLGMSLALGLIAVHLGLSAETRRQLALMTAAGVIGLTIDTLQLWWGVFRFTNETIVPWLAPLWVGVLWIQFATILPFSLRWLSNRYWLSAVLGFIGGPLAYYAGEAAGAVGFLAPRLPHFLLVGLFWSLALPAVVWVSDLLDLVAVLGGRYRFQRSRSSAHPHRVVIIGGGFAGLTDGVLDYDTLVVATGASHYYFGNDPWQSLAPGLKTIEDATDIRRRIFIAFEAAERAERPEEVQELLTFVVVGGGPTGVELAGAIAEIARDTLAHEFRSIDPADARIVLLEGTDRVLPSYPGRLPAKAQKQLEQLGVTVRTGTLVSDIAADHVTIRAGEQTERIPTRTVLWAAGVTASNLARRIASLAGIETDRAGRIPVQPALTVAGYPEVLVIGDMANFACGPLRFSGYLAWFAWLFVHLMNLVEFRDRVFVLIEWAWNYVTWNRGARLITGTEHLPAGYARIETSEEARPPS